LINFATQPLKLTNMSILDILTDLFSDDDSDSNNLTNHEDSIGTAIDENSDDTDDEDNPEDDKPNVDNPTNPEDNPENPKKEPKKSKAFHPAFTARGACNLCRESACPGFKGKKEMNELCRNCGHTWEQHEW
jgi:hypothetical protein